jgi:hypothetical protein
MSKDEDLGVGCIMSAFCFLTSSGEGLFKSRFDFGYGASSPDMPPFPTVIALSTTGLFVCEAAAPEFVLLEIEMCA